MVALAEAPLGIVAHRHPGDQIAHVHVSLRAPWWSSGNSVAHEQELPFAANDTPVDWWSQEAASRRLGVGLWGPQALSNTHVHSFSPFQPTLLELAPLELAAEVVRLAGGVPPGDSPHQALTRWRSRAPPPR